jgi:transposase
MMSGMAFSYRAVDRSQAFLLPPDMAEWLPSDHLVWFVIEVVERVDTSALHAGRRLGGVGRRGYDPDMLLALLVYAYCTKQRSSRQIERLCEVDVAYRIVCAGDAPDHTTIARFRQEQAAQAKRLFVEVLELCAEAGLASVGVVAVDGTKMAADAASRANRTRESIEAQVQRLFDEADTADAAEDEQFGDARGDEVPAKLRGRADRARRLDAALQQLRERREAEEAADAERAAKDAAAHAAGRERAGRPRNGPDKVAQAEAALARQQERAAQRRADVEQRYAAQGRKPPGPPPVEPQPVREARRRVERAKREAASPEQRGGGQTGRREPTANTTDPDSRVMKTHNGWLQGYNAQAAANEHGVVLAAAVTQDAGDVGQCVPMMNELRRCLDAAGVTEPVGLLLFDAGYWSADNATANGPDRLIATQKDARQRRAARDLGATSGPPPPGATPQEAMDHRLRTDEGAAAYSRRGCTIEPVFGEHKHLRGYRGFVRRGREAAEAEWQLINVAHNVLKMFRAAPKRA